MTITTRDSLLTIRGLSASVDETPILHDIDLAVGPGETHVIMGPNGAGKSTLGHVVMGDAAYRMDGGSVEFDGRDITDLSPDKRSRAGLFLSFQAPVEIPGVPLSSFLRATVAGRDGKELKGKQFKKHVRTLADELDMDPSYLDRELGVGFSGGEKKKLEMLQLLLLEPKLAILDETDSGLDVDALGVVSRGIDAYRRATGGALVVITHNTRILEHVDVDRVHVMVRGRMVAEGDSSLIESINEQGLKALDTYQRMEAPDWGPGLEGLDMDHIVTYVKPATDQQADWESLPDDVKNTFDRLGIPEAERAYLAGVGAQYDSELVYHNMQKTAADMGIVYSGIEEALREPKWEALIREKFMTLIPPTDHKFAALHGAVWSGGSFVYVPKGVKLDFPLQSYFRLNAKGAGQFEHTLIIVEDDASLHFIEGCSAPKYNVANLHAGAVELFVGKRASLRYSTIENWSKNMYNLNTKRAVVQEGGAVEWISGSFGSHVGYLYPMSILAGRKSTSSFTGITFAGAGQNLDTGCKVVLAAPDTSATVETKSISKGGGASTFRSSIVATENARGAAASVSCQSLMLDDISRSDTIPAMDIRCKHVDIGHEATIGRIGDDKVFYLMSRGVSEEEARTMIVNGFADPVSKELPLEYAVEMNNLIKLEMEGAIG